MLVITAGFVAGTHSNRGSAANGAGFEQQKHLGMDLIRIGKIFYISGEKYKIKHSISASPRLYNAPCSLEPAPKPRLLRELCCYEWLCRSMIVMGFRYLGVHGLLPLFPILFSTLVKYVQCITRKFFQVNNLLSTEKTCWNVQRHSLQKEKK